MVQARINAVLEEEGRRKSDQRDEFNATDYLRRIESEIGKLAVAEDEQREAAAACQRESAELERSLPDSNNAVAPSDFWARKSRLLEQTQERYRSDYQQYLGAKPLADERSSRERELKSTTRTGGARRCGVEALREQLSELSEGFDGAALAAVRQNSKGSVPLAATESANLENARRENDREEGRFREWQEACARRDEIDRVVARLGAAIKLTELARVVLRDSAPIVAQQLCDRIAAQAQRIFNRINHEPVELRWEAAPRYSLPSDSWRSAICDAVGRRTDQACIRHDSRHDPGVQWIAILRLR